MRKAIRKRDIKTEAAVPGAPLMASGGLIVRRHLV